MTGHGTYDGRIRSARKDNKAMLGIRDDGVDEDA